MAFDRGSSRYYFLCSKIHFFGMTEIYLSVTVARIFDNMIERNKNVCSIKLHFALYRQRYTKCKNR